MIKIVQIMLISKADCFARDYILFSKLLEVSEVFQSFTCVFKWKPLRMQSQLTSDKQWNLDNSLPRQLAPDNQPPHYGQLAPTF